MKKRTYYILGGAVLLMILLASVFGGGPEVPQVTTDTIGRHRIVETVIASGRIQPEVEVKVSAEASTLDDAPIRQLCMSPPMRALWAVVPHEPGCRNLHRNLPCSPVQ